MLREATNGHAISRADTSFPTEEDPQKYTAQGFLPDGGQGLLQALMTRMGREYSTNQEPPTILPATAATKVVTAYGTGSDENMFPKN